MEMRSTRPRKSGNGPEANTSTRLDTFPPNSSSESILITSHIARSFLNHWVVLEGAWLGIGYIRKAVKPIISDSETSVSLKLGSHPTPSR